jgi:hypothetical protein
VSSTAIERRRDRAAVALESGLGLISPVAVVAGVLVAYSAFAVFLALAGAGLRVVGVELDLAGNWKEVGTGAGIVAGVLLFLAYLLGGYVTGRMAWRAGVLHGILVFVGGIVLVGLVAALARSAGDTDNMQRLIDALDAFGVPTSAGAWGQVGSVAGIASLAGMFFGSILGGYLGEHWYTKLSRRAGDIDLRSHPGKTGARPSEASAAPGATTVEEAPPLEDMTKEELYGLAQDLDIPGRSQMTKEQLIEAIQAQEQTRA